VHAVLRVEGVRELDDLHLALRATAGDEERRNEEREKRNRGTPAEALAFARGNTSFHGSGGDGAKQENADDAWRAPGVEREAEK
jgi:hypothetical protein